ncbi:MAG: hypothetical protein KDA29_05425 [Phycisphaerales bacterium]|nr:hypothetical protein [Phycisphaerales bacterium]
MSVRDRQQDAAVLWQSGRQDGALLSLLVAVAATSRKRYPRSLESSDRKAFTKFLHDEMLVLTGGAVENFNIHVSQASPKHYPDGFMPMEDVFYEFIRCALAHEGKLPDHVRFFEKEGVGWSLDVDEQAVRLTTSFIELLSNVVVYAPENLSEFPENIEKPDDVIGWELFGKRRDAHKEYLAKRRARVVEFNSTDS